MILATKNTYTYVHDASYDPLARAVNHIYLSLKRLKNDTIYKTVNG